MAGNVDMQHATGLPARLRSWANAGTAVGTIVTGIVLMMLFRQVVSPWLRDHMGDQKLLDLMYWRTPADLTAALMTYGNDGREFYRNVLLVDLLFPVVYSIPLALSVAYTAPQLPVVRRYAGTALLLPFAGGTFDWSENVFLWLQTSRFPDHSDMISWIAFAMTFLKFTALITSLVIIVLGLIAALRDRLAAPSDHVNPV